jgi:hypothetical protein
MSVRALMQVEGILSIFVNFGLINHKNPTFVKLGTYIIRVLLQLSVKYYMVLVSIIEGNFSFKLKNHSFPDIRLYAQFLCFDVRN